MDKLMTEYICKKDLFDFFKKGEVYKVTSINPVNVKEIIQIGYINFSLLEDNSSRIKQIPDYLISWLKDEWKQMIKDKGSLVNASSGTSAFVCPYIYEYFCTEKEARKIKIKRINEN